MNIGKAIKFCHTQKGLDQSELADLVHLSVSYISLLERGRRNSNFSVVENIATVLGIPVVVLVFLGSSRGELGEVGIELAEKLSYVAINLMSPMST